MGDSVKFNKTYDEILNEWENLKEALDEFVRHKRLSYSLISQLLDKIDTFSVNVEAFHANETAVGTGKTFITKVINVFKLKITKPMFTYDILIPELNAFSWEVVKLPVGKFVNLSKFNTEIVIKLKDLVDGLLVR